MPIRRFFLDWTKPALSQASDYLVSRFCKNGFLDLSNVNVVVPGARAGRILAQHLFVAAQDADLAFLPPNIQTVGQLPESLYTPALPFASQVTQHLAWAKALRQTERKTLQRFLSNIPKDKNDPRWVELGILLQRQHRELAGEGLNFKAVVERGESLSSFNEQDRWLALSVVQNSYLHILDDLQLWDRQTARLVAIEKHECISQNEIVLVATADMSLVLRQMLDQVADRVTSLIFAPEELADRFDEHGCIVPLQWQQTEIAIKDENISYVDSITDQANAVVHHISKIQDQYCAEEIAIGIPDENSVPTVEMSLQHAGLKGRWGAGRSLEASRPIRLLRCLADYLRHQEYGYFAEFVRQPDLRDWQRKHHVSSETILRELDSYHAELLPAKIHLQSLKKNGRFKKVAELVSLIQNLLTGLLSKPRKPHEWTNAITQLLDDIYGDRLIDINNEKERFTLSALDAIRESLEMLEQIPDDLAEPVTAWETILMLLSQISSRRAAPEKDAAAIEMLGWLELSLDDSPVTIITNFNEGVVPSSIDSDLFLPNNLRSELGIDDSRRLFARDVYAISTMCASKSELCVIAGRRRVDGDPILPSRLLFNASKDTILQRSLRFFDGNVDNVPSPRSHTIQHERHQFHVPLPTVSTEPIEHLRVTDFRLYLACPYRFYLQKVAKVQFSDDTNVELDGAGFGNLMHKVLENFGNSAERDSSDSEVIRLVLNDLLNQEVKTHFGKHVRSAVRVQVEQMRIRLDIFAQQQANRRQHGWKIFATESENSGISTQFLVDGQPTLLTGRIDRIDRHEHTGNYCILDYKSSDRGDSPRAAHFTKSNGWHDLQLPLYRHLAKELKLDGTVELGYASLPKDPRKSGFKIADWSDEELNTADEVAKDVVRGIRAKRFWPPVYPPPSFSDDFAAICQDHVYDRNLPELEVSNA